VIPRYRPGKVTKPEGSHVRPKPKKGAAHENVHRIRRSLQASSVRLFSFVVLATYCRLRCYAKNRVEATSLFIHTSHARLNDVNILDILIP